jgi:hypothetical protein
MTFAKAQNRKAAEENIEIGEGDQKDSDDDDDDSDDDSDDDRVNDDDI